MKASSPRCSGKSTAIKNTTGRGESAARPVHRFSLQNIEEFPSMRRTPGETSQEVAAASPAPSSRSPMNEKGSKATNSTTSERKKRALLSAGAGNIRRGSLTMMANQLERLEAREPEDVHRCV